MSNQQIITRLNQQIQINESRKQSLIAARTMKMVNSKGMGFSTVSEDNEIMLIELDNARIRKQIQELSSSEKKKN